MLTPVQHPSTSDTMSTQSPTTPGKDAPTEKPTFTERELRHITAAMLSLKTGLPDIDYTKFQKNGEFNTIKTAQNTWGVLKKKIMAMNPEAAEAAAGMCISRPSQFSHA